MQKRFELCEGAIMEISDSILQLKKALARGDIMNIENEANRIKNRAALEDEERIKNLDFKLELAAKRRDLRSVIENYLELA
ncbi:MAG: hypothetical protein Q8930_19375 [Bacillota bacterium]|nr:hypothetical protein [Bacillota bacterium]